MIETSEMQMSYYANFLALARAAILKVLFSKAISDCY